MRRLRGSLDGPQLRIEQIVFLKTDNVGLRLRQELAQTRGAGDIGGLNEDRAAGTGWRRPDRGDEAGQNANKDDELEGEPVAGSPKP